MPGPSWLPLGGIWVLGGLAWLKRKGKAHSQDIPKSPGLGVVYNQDHQVEWEHCEWGAEGTSKDGGEAGSRPAGESLGKPQRAGKACPRHWGQWPGWSRDEDGGGVGL